MKINRYFLFCLWLFSATLGAQTVQPARSGFVFAAAAGVSALRLHAPAQPSETFVNASAPNFKIGWMVNERTALLLYLPGSLYKLKTDGRTRDRGFEGFVPSVQYWFTPRCWILGGAGAGMDAPAFYDIKNETERKFYFGAAALAATGFDVYKRNTFAVDVQARLHYGTANLPNGRQSGTAFSLLIGINWY
jgi:hypothetical protein